jgi:hypothetical protein
MIKTSGRSADLPTDNLAFEFQNSSQGFYPVCRCIWLTGDVILHDTVPLNLWVYDGVFPPADPSLRRCDMSVPFEIRAHFCSHVVLHFSLRLARVTGKIFYMNLIYNMLLFFNKKRSSYRNVGRFSYK